MHLFAPERPELSSGIKTLLLDGSAVPHVLVQIEPDGSAKLQCLLRHHDTHGGYGWHSCLLPLAELEGFFNSYTLNPEATLEEYLGWKDNRPLSPNVRQPVNVQQPSVPARSQDQMAMEDLI